MFFRIPRNAIVIFDCDGTITRFPDQAASFVKAYPEAFASHFGLTTSDATRFLSTAARRVRENPSAHGMKDTKGRIVAPGMADPYVFHRTIAGVVLDELHRCTNPQEREHALHAVHKACYGKDFVLQKGARELIVESFSTMSDSAVHVVTGSDTQQVQSKFASVLPTGTHLRDGLVWGNARKHVITDREDNSIPSVHFHAMTERVPEVFMTGYVQRPLYPRRGFYYNVLRNILDQYPGRSWGNVIVIGDILEFDGLLPLFLGASFILVETDTTSRWEQQVVRDLRHGFNARSLRDAFSIVLKHF